MRESTPVLKEIEPKCEWSPSSVIRHYCTSIQNSNKQVWCRYQMHGAGHGAVVSPSAYCNRRTRELANQRTHHLIFHTIFIHYKGINIPISFIISYQIIVKLWLLLRVHQRIYKQIKVTLFGNGNSWTIVFPLQVLLSLNPNDFTTLWKCPCTIVIPLLTATNGHNDSPTLWKCTSTIVIPLLTATNGLIPLHYENVQINPSDSTTNYTN